MFSHCFMWGRPAVTVGGAVLKLEVLGECKILLITADVRDEFMLMSDVSDN